MLRYCDGTSRHFKELYQRHSKSLYRFIALAFTTVEWLTADVKPAFTQKARPNYRQRYFKTFLYQIARNRLIDFNAPNQLLLDQRY